MTMLEVLVIISCNAIQINSILQSYGIYVFTHASALNNIRMDAVYQHWLTTEIHVTINMRCI